jgi:glycosyltransferase 2 family protein
MRNFTFAVVLLLAVVFVIGRTTEVQSILETLQRGDWRYLLLAFIFQSAALLASSFSYKTIYSTLGLKERISSLLPMTAAAYFLNVVAPSGGMSGIAVFVTEARRRGYSPGKAAVANVLFLLFEYAAFLCVLALGLIVQFRRNDLDVGELSASAILLLLSIVLAGLMYLGMYSADLLGKVLAGFARNINRVFHLFIKREYLSEKRAYAFAAEAAQGIQEFANSPSLLILPSLLAIAKQGLLVMVFFFNFLAFKVSISLGTLIAGYSIGYLFVIVSPTPAGLGVVEGMLTLTLRSMYVPIGAAAVVTLGYRFFSFWYPFIFGLISLRWLEKGYKKVDLGQA